MPINIIIIIIIIIISIFADSSGHAV